MHTLFIILACFAGVFAFAFLSAASVGLQDTDSPRTRRDVVFQLIDATIFGAIGSIIRGFGRNRSTQADARRLLYAGLASRRIIALNDGVQEKVRPYTQWEDFTTGEQNEFKDVPESRWVGGEQWHILSFLGCSHQGWTVPGCKYKKSELADYVRLVTERGGVVSIDAMLFRDGGLDRSQLELLKALDSGRSR